MLDNFICHRECMKHRRDNTRKSWKEGILKPSFVENKEWGFIQGEELDALTIFIPMSFRFHIVVSLRLVIVPKILGG